MPTRLAEPRSDSTGPDPLDAARRLAPAIAAAAPEIEAGSRLPEHVLAALHGAGLFRTLLPARFGGAEIAPARFAAMMETIAAADASTAWCIGQASGCSMAAAWMEPAAAMEVFGHSDAVLAWGTGKGEARPVEGGWIVSGRWAFASGSRNATWMGGHVQREEHDGPVERSMLFPRAQAMITADWNVVGLRGTGSDTYEVRELFVPAAFSVVRLRTAERREQGPLYRFNTTHLYAAGFASAALGVARAMLDAFLDQATSKAPRATGRVQRESTAVQREVGRAEGRLGAARAFLHAVLGEAWAEAQAAVESGGEISMDGRMRIRLATTFASQEARAVSEFAYAEAGAGAIFEAGPFERRMRDMHAICQQVQAHVTHFETYGAWRMGLPPAPRFV
jgi:alkylation response protein AidB-like acyl-CoA dehydrogenase